MVVRLGNWGAPSKQSASGVFDLNEVNDFVQKQQWPMGFVPTTWNPSDMSNAFTLYTGNTSGYSRGNGGSIGFGMMRSIAGRTSGKWYWENLIGPGGSVGHYVGVADASVSNTTYNGDHPNSVGYYVNGSVYVNGAVVATHPSYTLNDYIGVALDLDNRTVAFYKNGTITGTPISIPAGTWKAAMGRSRVMTGSDFFSTNFGQGTFVYPTPPDFEKGFY